MVCSSEHTARRSVFIGYAVLVLLIFIGIVHTAQEHQLPPSNEVPRHDFDWQLAQQVFRNEESNVVFSPFSVKLLLTLLYEASEPGSQTHKQLGVALCERNINETRVFYDEFLKSATKANDNYEFDIGTKVFLDKTQGKLSPNYTELLEQTYSTSFERVAFDGSKATADKINSWCEEVTRGRINEIVTEDTLLESQMILANVLFLKASWRNSFLDKDTKDLVFQLGVNASVKTPFMTQIDLYEYTRHEGLGAEVLRLPYKGRDFSMNILLPFENVSLDALAGAMSTSMLNSFRFGREEVTVVIPKFSFNYGTLLNEPLRNLGIRDIFGHDAFLPLLATVAEGTEKNSSQGSPEVSKILQKAGIEINEKGTLASAATELQLVSKFGYDDQPIVFHANRPFVFYIHDQETDTILFVGKVMDPSTGS
uniref:Serpin domain-containing protein n=1 Tax=Anopheles atroparvus TaxID=41427 RepID=A0A182ILB3_ANOAO